MYITRVTETTDELVLAIKRLIPQLTRAPIPSRADLETLLASSTFLLIARQPDERGQIVGAAALVTYRSLVGFHAHIEDVVVDEAMRGQGIGEALLRRALEIASGLGLKGVSLTTNPRRDAANRLYQKMGFKRWETNLYWYDLK
jgi:GNAT superfamily N-acetyltransferase